MGDPREGFQINESLIAVGTDGDLASEEKRDKVKATKHALKEARSAADDALTEALRQARDASDEK